MMIPGLVVKEKMLVIEASLQALVDERADVLRGLLSINDIPEELWNDIWQDLDKPPWKEADEDLDVQWMVGFIRGIACALGTTERKLVTL